MRLSELVGFIDGENANYSFTAIHCSYSRLLIFARVPHLRDIAIHHGTPKPTVSNCDDTRTQSDERREAGHTEFVKGCWLFSERAR